MNQSIYVDSKRKKTSFIKESEPFPEYRLNEWLTLTLYEENVADSRSRTDVKIVNKWEHQAEALYLFLSLSYILSINTT